MKSSKDFALDEIARTAVSIEDSIDYLNKHRHHIADFYKAYLNPCRRYKSRIKKLRKILKQVDDILEDIREDEQ